MLSNSKHLTSVFSGRFAITEHWVFGGFLLSPRSPNAGGTSIVLLMKPSPNDWILMLQNYLKGEVKRTSEVGTYDEKKNFLVLCHWINTFPFQPRENQDSNLNFQFEKIEAF